MQAKQALVDNVRFSVNNITFVLLEIDNDLGGLVRIYGTDIEFRMTLEYLKTVPTLHYLFELS